MAQRSTGTRVQTVDGRRLYRCMRCGGYFPRADFPPDARMAFGLGLFCHPCWEARPKR